MNALETPALLTLEEANTRIYRYGNSYQRMGMVMGLCPMLPQTQRSGEVMESDDWFRLLGTTWSGCDNIAEYSEYLEFVFNEYYDPAYTRSLMMTPGELAKYKRLRKTLTAYRGCANHNRDGFSWTLDKAEAIRFATQLNRYKVEHPILLTGTISKYSIIAYKNDREEQEVIIFPEDVQNVTEVNL
jgi:hypothetical protein